MAQVPQMTSYDRHLQSTAWKQKRIARLQIDGYRCRLCDSIDDLEVHHRPSSYARIPNESVEDDLLTVCRLCHELVTERIRTQRYAGKPLPCLPPQAILGLRSERNPSTVPDVVCIPQPQNRRVTAHVVETPCLEARRLPSPGHAQRPLG